MTTAPLLPSALLPARGTGFFVLDLSSWARGIYEGARSNNVLVDAPENDLVVRGVIRRLVDDVLVARAPRFFAVAADIIGDEGGRRLLWPQYKVGRKPPGPGYARQIGVLLEIFAAHRIPVFQSMGYEADDYVAALAFRARACGERVVILSKDQDLWQLFEDADPAAVLSWDVTGARVCTTADCERAYGVAPSKLVDVMALAGDGDEAPGIHGIGDKKAAAIITRHGSLETALTRWQWEKGKLSTWLRDGAADARLSRQLVQLDTSAPVHVDLQPLVLGWDETDTFAIWAAARKYGISILLDARTSPKPAVDASLAARWDAAGAELVAASRGSAPAAPVGAVICGAPIPPGSFTAKEVAAMVNEHSPTHTAVAIGDTLVPTQRPDLGAVTFEPEMPPEEEPAPCHPRCQACANRGRAYLTREQLQVSTCRHCGLTLDKHSNPQIGTCASALGLEGCNLLDWLGAPAPAPYVSADSRISFADANPDAWPDQPWRKHLPLHDGVMGHTPVGRWQLLVGRWARLVNNHPKSPPVYALILESPPYDDAWTFDTLLLSRAIVRFDGVDVEHSIINALVDVYLQTPPPGLATPVENCQQPAKPSARAQLGFDWEGS